VTFLATAFLAPGSICDSHSNSAAETGGFGPPFVSQETRSSRSRQSAPSAQSRDSSKGDDELKSAQDALSKRPVSADALVKLADVYRRRRRYTDAIPAYQRAARMRPDYFEAYFGLGEAYRGLVGYASSPADSTKSAAAAIQAYKRAIQIRPDSPEAHFGLAQVYNEQKRQDDALEELEIATKLKPDFAEAIMEIGMIYFWPIYGATLAGPPSELDSDREESLKIAIGAFRRVVELSPTHELAYLNLARACDLLGRYDEAIRAFLEVIRITPYGKWGEAYFGICETFRKAGRLSEGIQTFKERVKQKPDGTWEHYSLGILYLYSGDKGAALEQYRIMKNLGKYSDLAESLFKEIYR